MNILKMSHLLPLMLWRYLSSCSCALDTFVLACTMNISVSLLRRNVEIGMSAYLIDVVVDPLHHFALFGNDCGQLREDALFHLKLSILQGMDGTDAYKYLKFDDGLIDVIHRLRSTPNVGVLHCKQLLLLLLLHASSQRLS